MDEWPREVTTPLKYLARVIVGQAPPSGAVTDLRSGLAFVQGNAEFGPVHPRPTLECDRAPKVAEKGDILLSVRAPVGAINVADQALGIGRGLAAIRPNADTDGRYLRYVLSSSISSLRSFATGTTYEAITADDISGLVVPRVSADQQRRIADFLDDQVARIDNIIAARRMQIALVTAARQVEVISRLLAGGDLTGSASAAWYRNLPSSWPVRPLRAAWQVIDCKHRTPAYVRVGYPVVSPGDISPAPLDFQRCHRFVDEADYADLADALRRCRLGDIVYSRNASAGTAALVTTDEPFTMGQDVCRITSARHSQRYLYYVLNFAVSPQLEAARVGSTFTRINIDEIKSLRVPVPPDSEQERISNGVDRLIAEFVAILATESRQITLMEELKRSLITAAVTGEFEVSTADGSRALG